ncbi:hypothetical protein COO60DRAFT_1635230 [Scenedesmus sp. NREL 46B-D3]|nr:hypothetical protein COO60DRAFT_1635230 [Scenedesmus sp. NREL 46B-D3]
MITVHGDCYSWHVDADPSTFPSPSPWTDAFGSYCNREPGKPLLFSLLLYLDGDWPLEHDAETLFLDSVSDTGVVVRPRRFRAVLMDQDVVHRLSAPSHAAGRPRYSLVWKLVMLPKQPGGSCSLARPDWGPPTYFGSAAHVRAAATAAAAAAAGNRSRLAPPAAAAAAAAPAAGVSVSIGRELSGQAQLVVGCKRPAAGDADDQQQ